MLLLSCRGWFLRSFFLTPRYSLTLDLSEDDGVQKLSVVPEAGALGTETLVGIVDTAIADEGVKRLLLALDELFRVESQNSLSEEAATHLLELDLVLIWKVGDGCA